MMTIDAINFLQPVAMPSLSPLGAASASAVPAGAFGAWFEQQLVQVNQQIIDADQGVQRLAAGDANNLHDVMIKLQESKMSLQLVMQVRNHLLDAYHDIAQMQL
jgi:flagellar hook-basal body complex protein FliE